MGQHTKDMGFSLLPLLPNTAVSGLDQNPLPPSLPMPQPGPAHPPAGGWWGRGKNASSEGSNPGGARAVPIHAPWLQVVRGKVLHAVRPALEGSGIVVDGFLRSIVHPAEAEQSLEGPLEIVWEKAIEDGVGTAIGIAQDDGELADGGVILLYKDIDQLHNVEGHPTDDKDHHHHHDHEGDLALRAFALLPASLQSHHAHLGNDEDVAEADGHHWQQEAHQEGVDHKDHQPPLGGLRHEHVASHRSITVGRCVGEDDDGQDDEDGKHPDTEVDHLSHGGPAVPGCLDGVHHSDVAVHAEHSQAVDTGEHIDGIHAEHQAAEQRAKGPVVQQGGGDQEGDAKHQQLVRNGQVKDVDVGGRLHLGVA